MNTIKVKVLFGNQTPWEKNHAFEALENSYLTIIKLENLGHMGSYFLFLVFSSPASPIGLRILNLKKWIKSSYLWVHHSLPNGVEKTWASKTMLQGEWEKSSYLGIHHNPLPNVTIQLWACRFCVSMMGFSIHYSFRTQKRRVPSHCIFSTLHAH